MKFRISLLPLLAAAALVISGCGKSAPPAEPDYSVLETNAPPAALESTNTAGGVSTTPVVRLDAKPGSQVRIEGTSTMHDWQVVGKLIGGFAEVPSAMIEKKLTDLKPGKIDLRAELFIPVRSMHSVTKEGNAYSSKMDDIMYEKLLADQHPKIFYRSTEAKLVALPSSPEAPYSVEAKGELVVAGVTNVVIMPVQLVAAGENTFKASGTVKVKMTDFKIKPPAPIGMFIETGDEVKLLFNWLVARKPAVAAN